jgi:diguanylate cyclase (GGDEF)-like protein
LGVVSGSKTPSTFTVASVPGTAWRLVIAVPDSRLYVSIAGWTQLIPWLVVALVSILGVLLMFVFARLMALSERMARNARTDSLTGLFNRRAVTEHLTRAAARARRSGEPMSVLMIDLDRFKETNDHYGHRAGDQVLCAVANCMRDVLRGEDIYGRWGGDEFVVLLPTATERDAQAAATRLRNSAAGVDLNDVGLPNGIPMSIGIATSTRTTSNEIIHAADLALYTAKTTRGTTRAHDPDELPRTLDLAV